MNKEGRCEKKKADRYMREGRRGRKKVQTREEQNKVEEKGKSLFLFFKLIKKKQRTTYKRTTYKKRRFHADPYPMYPLVAT
jgi:hypothetical protein